MLIKNLLIFISLIFFISCSNDKKTPKDTNNNAGSSDLQKVTVKYFKDYKGNLSSFNEYIKPISQEQSVNKHHIRVYLNEENQVFREEEYSKQSTLVRYSKFFYKDDIRIKEESYNEFDELLYIRFFDEEKKLVKEESFMMGEMNSYNLFNYNENKQLTRIEQYNPSGYLVHVERYYYKKNKLKKIEARNANKKLIYYKVFNYNEGELTHIDIFDSNNKKTNVYSISEQTDIDYNSNAEKDELNKKDSQ